MLTQLTRLAKKPTFTFMLVLIKIIILSVTIAFVKTYRSGAGREVF